MRSASNLPSAKVHAGGEALERRFRAAEVVARGELEPHFGGIEPALDAENAELERQRATEHRPAVGLDKRRSHHVDVHAWHRRGRRPASSRSS